MKLFLFSFLLFFLSLSVQATEYELLFSFNETSIASEMEDLTKLEQLVNNGNTEDALNIYNGTSPMDSSDSYVKKSNKIMSDKNAFYTGFVAGCVGTGLGYCFFLGPVAILVVYLYCDDKQTVRETVKGCLAGSAIGGTFLFSIFTISYLYGAGII